MGKNPQHLGDHDASFANPDGRLQRYAFLGPRGTFCQQALNQVAAENTALHIPALDAPRAIDLVRQGKADYAVVPIENSVEGGINATLDALGKDARLVITGEVIVPISFVLAVKDGTHLSDIRRISTHNAAWTQCRDWIMANLPAVEYLPAASTAAGAAHLMESDAPGYEATLVSPLAAKQYGLTVLRDDVADNPDAQTRFVVIGKAGEIPSPTGKDKTTLLVQLPTDAAGALLQLLTQFAALGINLSRIESRPVGDALGRYAFSIDAIGHIAEQRMRAVLAGLHRVSPKVTFLGSYPAAPIPATARSAQRNPLPEHHSHHAAGSHAQDPAAANGTTPKEHSLHKLTANQPTPGTRDADFYAANAWVESLLGKQFS
ncbi:prephenate dehydratase [Arcanobacterium hippocoleae]|uniref:Prephenate dehydratase n=1 Tax=Arcanobacterium hippocoleae TaxID=149017 RepID=A0ABU1T460_9ACTO|nr:prephenate dehydratase [Arcanobacterium hippocoleae]MDR6939630.1 prephenate dehydratase [Arcanobacterium hippocoleae]